MADAAETENQSKKPKTSPTMSNGKATNVESTASKMPETYPYIDETVTDDYRFRKLGDDIITDCKPCECDAGFERYFDEEIICYGAWQAVWTSRHLGCDVLVLVKEKCFPDALVELVEPFCCSHPNSFADYALDGSGHKPKTKDDVTKFLSSKKYKVSLLELLPVWEQPEDLNKKEKTEDGDAEEEEDYDDDELAVDIDEIAEFLELYRFFYTYSWRVIFDDQYGGDYGFAYTDMYYRLKLHYEVKQKTTTQAIIKSYNKTMAEYEKKAWQFSVLRQDYMNPKRSEEIQKIGTEVLNLEKTLEKLDQQNQKRREKLNLSPKQVVEDCDCCCIDSETSP